jgi:ferredoxin/coenzyme F420-reducing hydrogenase delta subunit
MSTTVARSFSEIDPAVDRALDLLPTRITIDQRQCRGCARCIDVCSFGAIHLVDAEAPETTVRVSAALCRGCNLCTAVCPTDAAVPATVAPGWWGTKMEDLYPSLVASPGSQPPIVALACQRRFGAVEDSLTRFGRTGLSVQVVPIRCAGQIDAGMLLELYRHGTGRILVAGCLTGSCRYGCGPQLAAEQVLRAKQVLSQVGAATDNIITDWAAESSEQLADPQLLIADSPSPAPDVAGDQGGPE